ncbi:MAG: DMT family transporter [Sulfitobacter sp.]
MPNAGNLSSGLIHNSAAMRGLVLSVLLLGLNWPIMKLGLDVIPPFWMVSIRFGVSAPIIALFILLWHRRLPVLVRADMPVIIGVALLQFSGMMGLMTLALKHVPAGSASILIYTTPLWLVLLDWLQDHHRPRGRRITLSLLSAAGCGIIVLASGKTGTWAPLGAIFLAAAFWSLAIRQVSQHNWHGPVVDALVWQFLLTGLIMAVVAGVVEGIPDRKILEPRALWLLLFIGPLASGVGFGLMVAAARSLPAARVALISTATPLIGFFSANIILNEPILPLVALGGALMLMALVLGARS